MLNNLMKKYFKNSINYWKLYSLEKDYNTNIGEIVHRDIVKNPIVSSYMLEKGFNPIYPDNKSFAICLTHDIDEIYTPMIHRVHSLASLLTSSNVDNLKEAFLGFVDKNKSRYNNFNEILKLEEKYDAKSTFFFLASNRDPFRFRYEIEDIYEKLVEIKDKGFEIGLHGGYFSYDDSKALCEEKKRLEKVSGTTILGYRGHYLNFHIPHTWKHLSKLGFEYDTTLGYRRGSGFINGMCHPFFPYDFDEETEFDLLEIPLIIMDAAYPTLGFKVSKYWDEILNIIKVVEKNHGVLTINWHNDSLLSTRKSEHGKMYEKILVEGKNRGAWLSNCIEICNYWRTNFTQFNSEMS